MSVYVIEHRTDGGNSVEIYRVPDSGAFQVVADIMEELDDESSVSVRLEGSSG